MKMLYIKHRSGKRMNNFALSAILAAKELGIDFTIANNMSMAEPGHFEQVCEQYGIKMVHIDFDRNPLSLNNIKAGKQLLALMEQEKYDIVHCNTPSGGMVGRLCAAKAKIPKVIYMAHGFHFWKGAPLKNWLCYYPVERFLAHFTDRLITINQEDFARAQKFHYTQYLLRMGWCETDDVIFNTLGTAIGAWVWFWQLKRLNATKSTNDYDAYGNVIRLVSYDAEGNVDSQSASEYALSAEGAWYAVKCISTEADGTVSVGTFSENGDQTGWTLYDADGLPLCDYRWVYTYDADGHWQTMKFYCDDILTEEAIYETVVSDDLSTTFPETVTKYNEDGSKTVTVYDVDDNIVAQTEYDANGEVIS